jgi:site-specific DNA recombinase
MIEKAIKYFCYLRKSSESAERQALSIPAQMAEARKIFPDLDIEFIEESKSAFIPYERPEFQHMIERIRKGERTGLIAWHPDRLSRNEIDASTITYLLRTNVLEDLKFGAYHFTGGPEGIMYLQLALSQSQYESSRKGRDVKRGLEQKARTGSFPAAVLPEGYTRDRTGGKGNTRIISDSERLPLIKRAFEAMLTGNYSPIQIREMLNNQWGYRTRQGQKLGRSSIYNVLTRVFYSGSYMWGGVLYEGTHERIITPEEFDKVQAILGRKGRPRSKKHMLVFAGGMIRCGECGCGVTAEEKIKHMKNGKTHRWVYYHCIKRKFPGCSQGSIEETELLRQVTATLDSLVIPPEFHSFAMKWFKKENEKNYRVITESVESQNRSYTECIKRLENLGYMRANGEISPEEYASMKARELERKGQLERSRGATGARIDQWVKTGDEMLTFIESAKEKLRTGGYSTKRALLSTLGSNLVLKDRILGINLGDCLFPMQIVSEEVNVVYEGVRTNENTATSRSFEESCEQNPRLLRDLDSNQD